MARCPWKTRFICLVILAGGGVWAPPVFAFPTFREVKAEYPSSEAKLLARDGTLLQEVRVDSHARALPWVTLGQVSPALVRALLYVEDKRFFSHTGVDWKAAAGAVVDQWWRNRPRGASTLTMQLVQFLETDLKGRKTIWDKLRQANLAWKLEESWTKPEILEAYLNLVSFRGEHRGIAAASRALFDKDPDGLDLREAFFLASLLKSPGMNPQRLADRLCVYAAELPELGECAEMQAFVIGSLARPAGIRRRVSLAPHLAQKLLRPGQLGQVGQSGSSRSSGSSGQREVRSSVDAGLQALAIELLAEQVGTLDAQNVRDGAVVVVDNRSGEVRAYVGGTGVLTSQAPAVDMAVSRRQAGSTLKPFLYGLAFEKKYLTPQSWVLDEPLEVGVEGRGGYSPENYDRQFHGPVPAAVALGSSLNVPAVRTIALVGEQVFRDRLERLGFEELLPAEDYGPSLALGTADVKLVELANAYRTLAQRGIYSPLRYMPGQGAAKGKRVMPASFADLLSSILSDRENRGLTFGWESLLSTPYGAAVKTGTSKDMRDNWCVGYTRDFTVAVWVGNSGGDPMWQVSGVSGAAPVWRGLMDYLHRHRTVKPYPTLSKVNPPFQRPTFGKILYPTSDSILALDPDIPAGREIVQVEAEGAGELRVNDAALADGKWAPIRGKHRLTLVSSEGKLLDEVQVEVR